MNCLNLRAINEEWVIKYLPTDSQRLKLISSPGGQKILSIYGDVSDPQRNQLLLKKWLKKVAQQHLIPWLYSLSAQYALPFNAVTIRSQRTIWGSCNSEKNISINYKLLFLPPEYARHVMLHELCHTKHLNHSKRFWNLLQKLDPNTPEYSKIIRRADHFIPLKT